MVKVYPNQIGIYQIVCLVNNKRYIGSSKNISKRKSQHLKELRTNTHGNTHLQRSWNKYGEENFKFEQILICLKEDLLFYEDLIIKGYKSNKRAYGFNLREVVHSNTGIRTRRCTHRSGDKYNRLTLIKPIKKTSSQGVHYWLVRCECGTEREVNPGDVRHGHTKSCGCLNRERLVERITKWNLNNPEPWNKKNKTPTAEGGNVFSNLLGV